MRWRATLAAVLLTGGVHEEPSGPRRSRQRSAASCSHHPLNVLSATVSVVCPRTLTASLSDCRLTDVLKAIDSATPAVQTFGDSAVVLYSDSSPAGRYTLRAVRLLSGGVLVSDPAQITTGSLPADIRSYTASGSNPSPGYVVFAAGTYGLVVDNTGRVVWYRQFPNGPGLNFMAQPNGHYTARPTTPDPADIEPWLELDALGNITRTINCALGLQSRFHDLIAEPMGRLADVRTRHARWI